MKRLLAAKELFLSDTEVSKVLEIVDSAATGGPDAPLSAEGKPCPVHLQQPAPEVREAGGSVARPRGAGFARDPLRIGASEHPRRPRPDLFAPAAALGSTPLPPQIPPALRASGASEPSVSSVAIQTSRRSSKTELGGPRECSESREAVYGSWTRPYSVDVPHAPRAGRKRTVLPPRRARPEQGLAWAGEAPPRAPPAYPLGVQKFSWFEHAANPTFVARSEYTEAPQEGEASIPEPGPAGEGRPPTAPLDPGAFPAPRRAEAGKKTCSSETPGCSSEAAGWQAPVWDSPVLEAGGLYPAYVSQQDGLSHPAFSRSPQDQGAGQAGNTYVSQPRYHSAQLLTPGTPELLPLASQHQGWSGFECSSQTSTPRPPRDLLHASARDFHPRPQLEGEREGGTGYLRKYTGALPATLCDVSWEWSQPAAASDRLWGQSSDFAVSADSGVDSSGTPGR